jgi:hypothetical protein
MRHLFFLIMMVTTIISTSFSYAMDLSNNPLCQRNISGAIICPNDIIPSDTLILLQDRCPSGDWSSSLFDKTCITTSGSINTGFLKFWSIDKYLHTTSYLEDDTKTTDSLEYIINAEIIINIESITIDGKVFPIQWDNMVIINWITFYIINNKLVPKAQVTTWSWTDSMPLSWTAISKKPLHQSFLKTGAEENTNLWWYMILLWLSIYFGFGLIAFKK